jgi:4-amino-4-deoxy-L-arabinose transferase and related glycosyltransferases of PMT family
LATFVLDVLLLALLAAVLVIVATGGGVVHAFGTLVRARGVDNPIWAMTGLVVLRHALRDWPFLGVARWQTDALVRRAAGWAVRQVSALFSKPLRAVASVSIAVFLIRVLLAWTSPGFFSGDDVEIHEMTLGALLHQRWSVWDLRCAFFPMTFIYPAQRAAAVLGATSPQVLVLSGRVAVALLSTAAIPLVWWAARRLAPADSRVAVLSVLFLAVNKLQMSFGSSELPRPVSTVFVVAAFLCLVRERLLWSAMAGMLLGVAVAFRFSEVVFLPAALITVGRRYRTDGAVLLFAAGVTAATTIGIADALYWGHPFHSLLAAVDYTLVRGESSRGHEPFWDYLRIVPSWSTWIVVMLAVAGSSRRHAETWWLWTPVVLLSLFPHKESRYLLPVIPFLCIAAARGFLRIAEWLRHASEVTGWQRWARDLFPPLFALAVLHDVGGWRLARSNEGIRLAEYLRQTGEVGVAVQDSWRLGGRPYLSPLQPVVEVSPELLSDPPGFTAAIKDARRVALRSRVARTDGDRVLGAAGFERDPAWHGEDYVLYVRAR